jgi:hypothetical protein
MIVNSKISQSYTDTNEYIRDVNDNRVNKNNSNHNNMTKKKKNKSSHGFKAH